MTDNSRFNSLIDQLEGAIIIASDLNATLVVELLRMTVMASYQEAKAAGAGWGENPKDGAPT